MDGDRAPFELATGDSDDEDYQIDLELEDDTHTIMKDVQLYNKEIAEFITDEEINDLIRDLQNDSRETDTPMAMNSRHEVERNGEIESIGLTPLNHLATSFFEDVSRMEKTNQGAPTSRINRGAEFSSGMSPSPALLSSSLTPHSLRRTSRGDGSESYYSRNVCLPRSVSRKRRRVLDAHPHLHELNPMTRGMEADSEYVLPHRLNEEVQGVGLMNGDHAVEASPGFTILDPVFDQDDEYDDEYVVDPETEREQQDLESYIPERISTAEIIDLIDDLREYTTNSNRRRQIHKPQLVISPQLVAESHFKNNRQLNREALHSPSETQPATSPLDVDIRHSDLTKHTAPLSSSGAQTSSPVVISPQEALVKLIGRHVNLLKSITAENGTEGTALMTEINTACDAMFKELNQNLSSHMKRRVELASILSAKVQQKAAEAEIEQLERPSGRNGRESFLPCEDRLLYLGLLRYGPKDMDNIKSALLPMRQTSAIKNRYANRASKTRIGSPTTRSPFPSMLAYYREIHHKRPVFTYHEIVSLLHGLRAFQAQTLQDKSATLKRINPKIDLKKCEFISSHHLRHKGGAKILSFVKMLKEHKVSLAVDFTVASSTFPSFDALVDAKIKEITTVYATFEHIQEDTFS